MKFKICLFLIFIIFFLHSSSAVPITSFYFNTSNGNLQISENSIVRSHASIFQVLTDKNVLCKYTKNYGIPYEAMEGTFDFNFGMIHKENILNLVDGSYVYYVGCRNSTDTSNSILTATFNVITPVSAKVSLTSSSPLKSGLISVSLLTSKPVQNIPSLSYSFNGVNYNSIALSGYSNNWQGHFIIPVTTGESICSFSFSAQDLEGNTGNQISEGSVFLVDTIKPLTLINFDAIGYNGRIELNWHSEDDDISKYKIYRSLSPNIKYSDFFRETMDKDSFSDVSVESGKTYYYRLIPVDNAGNEGDFSLEVYATALLGEQNVSNGLSPLLIGLVDNVISSISLFMDDIEGIERSIGNKPTDEKNLFDNLGLSDEIKNSKSELSSLKNDVSKYKLQTLTRTELTSKLQAVELKMNTIKKKIPEDIIILETRETSNSPSQSDIEKLILEVQPTILSDSLRYKVENSLKGKDNYEFTVKSRAYNFEIIYLDGSRNKKAFIAQDISSNIGENSNFSIIEVIPKELVESASELDIKNPSYQILKDDPILSFGSSVKNIEYVTNKNIDLSLINELRTILLYNNDLVDKKSFITGYFSFIEINDINYGVSFGILILGSLFLYLYYLKSTGDKHSLNKVNKQISSSIESLSKGNIVEAKKIYNDITKFYSSLSMKNKNKIYDKISNLRSKLE